MKLNLILNKKSPNSKLNFCFDPLPYQTVTQPSALGGLGLPNIYNRIKTQRIMWIKRLIMERESPWLIIP